MDRIITKFEKLFSIRFTHPEYPFSSVQGGLLTEFLRLEPDLPTRKLFRQHDIHFRLRQDMLLCFLRIRTDEDVPFFRLPNILTARFIFKIQQAVLNQTATPDHHGGENLFRFRINLRSSLDNMNLSTATLGTVPSREPLRIFHPGDPSHWETVTVNLKGSFGILDIVTEGSSSHRLYTNVASQNLYYTTANGNEHEHLFNIHLNS